MSWHEVALSIERVAAGEGIRLMNEVERVFMAAGFPGDAAVFGDVDMTRDGSLFYFNPGASRIAQGIIARWGGTPRDDPGSPVALLIGHQQAYYDQNKKT